jgi:segregation and condensation protein B
MTDALSQPSEEPPIRPAEDLGRSYGARLSGQVWELDVSTPAAASAGARTDTPDSKAPPPLYRIVEALLFMGGPPLSPARAAETIRGVTSAQLTQAVDMLNQDYRRQGRPYAIRSQEHGFVLVLRPRFRNVLEKLYGGQREARLSPAAIDVLALVAYRQPATKQEIDGFRGADSGALLRQLVRRSLITVLHRGEASHREVSYGTTSRFLELFGLSSLDDLPQTQDLQIL